MVLLKYYIGIYGEAVGLGLVLGVDAWDFVIKGARGFLEYRIGPAGVLVSLLGVALIVASKHIKRTGV